MGQVLGELGEAEIRPRSAEGEEEGLGQL